MERYSIFYILNNSIDFKNRYAMIITSTLDSAHILVYLWNYRSFGFEISTTNIYNHGQYF